MECDDQKTDRDRSHRKPKTEKSRWEKFLDAPLCLHTESHIYCFRLNELGSEYWNWNPQTYPNDLKPLLPVSTFDFYDGGFPIGMGCFKLGSDWFMIGGERVLKEADIYKYQFVFNEKAITDSVYQGPSTKVFHLKLSSPDTLSLEPSSMVPSMIAGKARPIVLPTGGKIYAFHTGSVFNKNRGGIHRSFDPPFEVYDESEKVWKGVEDAPFVSREIGWYCRLPPICGHFVIGCKLFLNVLSRGSSCFDTSSGTWDRCSLFLSNMRSSFRKTHLDFPYHGNCVSVLGLDCAGSHLMFFIQTFELAPPKPFALLIHEDGTLHCYQDLSEELFVDFLPKLSSFVQSRFLDLGNGIVCAIIYGPDYCESEVLLHICIFEVEVLAFDMGSHPKPENKKFLKLNLLKNYFCKMTGVGHHILLGLVDAFFLQDAAAGGD